MNSNAKIYIAGHRGLVGSALVRTLQAQGYARLLTRPHSELDLTDQRATQDFFARERPEYVFLAAAKVGGIHANHTYPAEFIQQNLAIQTNVIHAAWQHGVQRLLFLGSSCIYPRDCPQPIKEEYLLTGPLEATNRPYAIAKIAGIEMCWSYNRQYGTRYLAVMPTNLYGPGDNYHPDNAHVLPALIGKMHHAKQQQAEYATAWGSGTPYRELLYSDDMAQACIFLMNLDDTLFNSLLTPTQPPLINIGSGEEYTIRDIAQNVREAVGYAGEIRWDTSKPDGTPRKRLCTDRLHALGWRARTPLSTGIRAVYEDYLVQCSSLIASQVK